VAPHAELLFAVPTHEPPQQVPFATAVQAIPLLFVGAVHTGWPVVHAIVPIWQTFPPGVQGLFFTQGTHAPL
jgi:hypothetical protein